MLNNLRKLVLLFSFLMLVPAGWIGAAEKSSQPVQVTIETILASNQNTELDAKLKPLEKQLKLLKYKSYRSLKEESQNVSWKSDGTFEIPGGRVLTVSPQELSGGRVSLKIKLNEGQKPLVDTTVKIQNKGNFILGGPPHEGGALVLSISAVAQ